MFINSIFGSARLALQAHQAAMETTSHNIANADVDGYTRQRVDLAAARPSYTPSGRVGNGVVVNDVRRVRDTMLDVNFRTQSAKANGFSTRSDLLNGISGVFGEPSETGLSATLDQFYSAWSDLANNPDSTAAKSVVQQRGAQVASTLNRYSRELDALAARTREQLDGQVTVLNRAATQIADLNRQIIAAESGRHTAGDLRDARDRLIDQMASVIPVQVVEHASGSASVYVANATVVDGVDAEQFSVEQSGMSFTLRMTSRPTAFTSPGGTIGAMFDALNPDVPNAKAELDLLAQRLVTTVNAEHRTGWTAAGDALGGANWNSAAPPTGSNVNFFDPVGVTAASISLSANVKASASFVAAGNVQYGTGNNAVALQLGALRDDTTTIAKFGGGGQTTSFGEYYRDLITRLGVATNDADASAAVYETLARQADVQRQSLHGVSTDDELIAMTMHQQAYAAAARVVTVADEMSQVLLDMVR